jgi:hypothetical protein
MPGSSKWSLSPSFLHLNPVCTSPLPYTFWRHAHRILLNLITQIVFGWQYRSFSFSLCSSLHYLVTSSPLLYSPYYILPLIIFSLKHSQHVFLLQCERPIFIHV